MRDIPLLSQTTRNAQEMSYGMKYRGQKYKILNDTSKNAFSAMTSKMINPFLSPEVHSI